MRKGGITIEDYKNLTVEVGFGENNFTMDRGSFKYKQKIHWKEKCKIVSEQKTENGVEVILSAPNKNQTFKLVLSEVGNKKELSMVQIEGNHGEVNRFWLTFPTNSEEHIYGCGETYSEFDLKGQNVRIWVAEHQNANRISKKIIKEKIRGKRPNKKLKFV